jgi:hypothetical protein
VGRQKAEQAAAGYLPDVRACIVDSFGGGQQLRVHLQVLPLCCLQLMTNSAMRHALQLAQT